MNLKTYQKQKFNALIIICRAVFFYKFIHMKNKFVDWLQKVAQLVFLNNTLMRKSIVTHILNINVRRIKIILQFINEFYELRDLYFSRHSTVTQIIPLIKFIIHELDLVFAISYLHISRKILFINFLRSKKCYEINDCYH